MQLARLKFRVVRLGTVGVVGAAALIGLPPPTSGVAMAPVLTTQAASLEGEDPSVVSLVGDYGISVEQARRQMEAQVAAGAAELNLSDDLRTTYVGRQIRHDDNGRVTVGVTDESQVDAMRAHFERAGVPAVQVEVFPTAKRSWNRSQGSSRSGSPRPGKRAISPLSS